MVWPKELRATTAGKIRAIQVDDPLTLFAG
jgi:hypothetical protein